MNAKKFIWTGVLAFSLGVLVNAQDASTTADPNQNAQSDQGAKSDMKDARHDTARAAKKTGHKIKKGTKRATHKAAKETEQGSQKVEDKTATPPQQ